MGEPLPLNSTYSTACETITNYILLVGLSEGTHKFLQDDIHHKASEIIYAQTKRRLFKPAQPLFLAPEVYARSTGSRTVCEAVGTHLSFLEAMDYGFTYDFRTDFYVTDKGRPYIAETSLCFAIEQPDSARTLCSFLGTDLEKILLTCAAQIVSKDKYASPEPNKTI